MMSNYSQFKGDEINDLDEQGVIDLGGGGGGGGGGGASTTQTTYLNVAASGTRTITHDADPNYTRIVQFQKYIPGSSGLTNTTLDFDNADESYFEQEDATNGTDFAYGVVTLHNEGSLVSGSWNTSASNSSRVTFSNNDRTAFVAAPGGWMKILTEEVIGKVYLELTCGGLAPILGWCNELWPTEGFPTDNGDVNPGSEPDNSAGLYGNGLVGSAGSPASGSLPVYVDGDIMMIAIDAVAKKAWVGKNGLWYSGDPGLGSTPSWAALPGNAFRIVGALANGNQTLAGNFGQTAFAYTIPTEFSPVQIGLNDYVTTTQFYVTTTNNNHLNLGTTSEINSCTITSDVPANTTLKCLASFDDRSTWSYWSGSAWTTTASGLEFADSNTVTELQNGFNNLTVNSGTMSYLDYAFELESTDNSVTPSVDLITVNYNEVGVYKSATIGTDYEITYLSSTQTQITKLSAGTDTSMKVNILI